MQPFSIERKYIRNKLEYIKEISSIGKYFEEPVKTYSSGMGSRLGFALSMAFDFQILLMDEITSVGDQKFQKTAKQMIDNKRDYANIIFVSHSVASIRKFAVNDTTRQEFKGIFRIRIWNHLLQQLPIFVVFYKELVS